MSYHALRWVVVAVISYVWLFTKKYDDAPWWGPTAFLVASVLPVEMLAELAKTLGLALIDKLPGRGAGK